MKQIITAIASASPTGFFSVMWSAVLDWAHPGFDFIAKAGGFCCAVVFFFNLARLAYEYKESQENLKQKIPGLIIPLIIASILLSKDLWLPAFTG